MMDFGDESSSRSPPPFSPSMSVGLSLSSPPLLQPPSKSSVAAFKPKRSAAISHLTGLGNGGRGCTDFYLKDPLLSVQQSNGSSAAVAFEAAAVAFETATAMATADTTTDVMTTDCHLTAKTNGRPSPTTINFKKPNLTLTSIYRKSKRRALAKNGDCNIILANIPKLRRRYMQDLFTTLVDAQWRCTLMVFLMSFILSWSGCGFIWYMIAYTHGDFAPENMNNVTWQPCVINMQSFTASFLFSIETQHTTGFGYRMVTEECVDAIAFFCFQSIAGLMIQAFMVGIVFTKMARPKQRSQTIMFSRNAVICQRDGQLCFMFRVGDMREKSHLIGASIRTRFIRSRMTPEGEMLSPHITHLKVSIDDYDDQVFLMWPVVAVHKIDRDSPIYDLSAADLLNERFEVAVILEGTTESTGQTVQARTSYLPSEVLWGHRFRPLVKYCKTKMAYEVDYSLFHEVSKVDTPLCSSKDLENYLIINNDSNQNIM